MDEWCVQSPLVRVLKRPQFSRMVELALFRLQLVNTFSKICVGNIMARWAPSREGARTTLPVLACSLRLCLLSLASIPHLAMSEKSLFCLIFATTLVACINVEIEASCRSPKQTALFLDGHCTLSRLNWREGSKNSFPWAWSSSSSTFNDDELEYCQLNLREFLAILSVTNCDPWRWDGLKGTLQPTHLGDDFSWQKSRQTWTAYEM